MARRISEDEYLSLTRGQDYYRKRWPYTDAALRLSDLVPRESVLEVGPWGCPIYVGSDTLDRPDSPLGDALTYAHDITETPWPIADGAYDLLVALQVWEHLEGHQRAAWGEARRVARSIILSVPVYWDSPRDRTHHGIAFSDVSRWVGNAEPDRTEIVGWTTRHPRMIALWRGV